MRKFSSGEKIAEAIIEQTAGKITLALPLGLGKANTIVNALTEAAIADRSIHLDIFTALTLERPEPSPKPSNELQRRFLGPAMDRLFGAYPKLVYAQKLRDGSLPKNIKVAEFFLLAGEWTGNAAMQQNYITANYTDVLAYLAARKPNVIAQLLARDSAGRLSLSCNPDITADLIKLRREGKGDLILAGEINSQLPYMLGPAADIGDQVDLLLDDPETDFELFSVVKRSVDVADQAIGLHVAGLVQDGGTIQIGIGSIGDAAAHAMIVRHLENENYCRIIDQSPFPSDPPAERETFTQGLYASTEMLVDGLLRMFLAGVVKREVDGVAIHAGFFVGSRDFYETLRSLPDERRKKISMMPVSFTNSLLGDEQGKRQARQKAIFVNNAMMATLMGAVVSDGTGDGQVVSGVGGQFDFVAQAFALSEACSVITLRATRESGGETVSNVVWTYPHTTIPRHLKDIVVTEYGIADLRGKSDAETIAEMLAVTDSRFQPALLDEAKRAGKIAGDYQIADQHRHNTPAAIANWLSPHRNNGVLPVFPFGTDFTEVEQRLLPALTLLKKLKGSNSALAMLAWDGWRADPSGTHDACLDRMGLSARNSVKEFAYACLLRGALRRTASDAPLDMV